MRSCCWLLLVSAVLLTDYLHYCKLCAYFFTFDCSLEVGWPMFLMSDEMHTCAFLPKHRSTCQIAFQVTDDVLGVSFLPFSKRKNCFHVFLLLVSSSPITYPAEPFWCEVSVLLPTANCFLNSKYVHTDTSLSTVCCGNQSQHHSPELPVAVPKLKAVYFQLAQRNHVCSQWEDSSI